MGLINVEDLQEEINNEEAEYRARIAENNHDDPFSDGVLSACFTISRIIAKQPAAYDVDKVIDQLELHSFSLGPEDLPLFYVRLDDAIKIVKEGGMDES